MNFITITPRIQIRLLLVMPIILLLGLVLRDNSAKVFRVYRQWVVDPPRINEYLSNCKVCRLQLGAGGHNPAGWLNSDIEPTGNQIYLDVTERFPFENESFRYIASEHVIEHVSLAGALVMLQECYRVLSEGGKIRIVTPNLDRLFRLIGREDDEETRRYVGAKQRLHGWEDSPVIKSFIFNREVRAWGHQFIYDSKTLVTLLERTGFKEIKVLRAFEQSDPIFQEAEYRSDRSKVKLDEVVIANNWEAMAIEAVR